MRPLLLLATILSLTAAADAETVRLRKKDNGNIIDVEVVELLVDKVTFRLPKSDQVYSVAWDSLDAGWIRQNSAAVWNEHELLLHPPQEKKEEKGAEPTADPFAKESTPTDVKDLLRNLSSALADRLRGIDPSNISNFCKETGTDESAFWKGYDDLRRAGGTSAETKSTDADKSSKPSRSKDSGHDRPAWERDPAGQARENQLRAEWDKGRGTLSCVGYIRTLAEGGYKGRLAWQLLRNAAEDRKAIITRLRKYEALAGEMADRADKPEARRDALVLRKLLGDVAGSFERISKDNATQEERLKSDCQSLLTRLNAGR